MTKEHYCLEKFRPATRPAHERTIQSNVFRTFKSALVDRSTYRRFERLQQNNPEFAFYFFDDRDMDEYMATRWGHREIYEVYSNLNFGAARADVWRYCILHDRGGFYLDFDSSLMFPLADIPIDANELVSFEGNRIAAFISQMHTPDHEFFRNREVVAQRLAYPEHTALQWLLAASKGHPLMELTILNIEKHAEFFRGRSFRSVHRAVCNLTGPIMYTRSLWEYVAAGNSVHQCGIDFEGKAKFKDVIEGDTYSIDNCGYADARNRIVLENRKLRLNIGCGSDVRRGWVNIDAASDDPRVRRLDIANVGTAFATGAVDTILVNGVIEHTGLPTATELIRTWASLLKPGGELTVQTTCYDLLLKAYGYGYIDIEDLNYHLFSGVTWHEGESAWTQIGRPSATGTAAVSPRPICAASWSETTLRS